jgi:macrolide-specific efflux system membrane fusion protein
MPPAERLQTHMTDSSKPRTATAGKRQRAGIDWRSIGLAGAVVVAASTLVFGMNRPVASAPPLPTATVELGDIESITHAAGVLQPRLKVDVGAQISGQVRRLHVKPGDWVRAGARLVSLDPEAARTAVQQAEAQLAQQAASLRRAEVELDAARRQAERQRRLLAGDATSEADQEQAALALARAETDLQGQRAALAQRQADLADRRLQLGRAEVLAPVDGQVVSLAVQEGQSVNAAMASPTLLTLAQLRHITVKARVPEAEIGRVQLGQAARFTTLALGSQRYEGKVQALQPIPERIGNALFYNVLFEVENPDGRLLSDMTVQVDLIVAQARQVPRVPVAVLGARDAEGRYAVQLLQPDGRTRAQAVRVGVSDEAYAQVLDGVKPGDRLVLASRPAAPASSASR